MKLNLRSRLSILVLLLAAPALFAGGYALGQNHFGQPKTIIHVVVLKWRPDVSEAQKKQVIDGIRQMAAKIPGIENVWLKPERIQPRDFNMAFVLEFKDRDAADAYAESTVHKAWDDMYVALRGTSFSIQVTN